MRRRGALINEATWADRPTDESAYRPGRRFFATHLRFSFDETQVPLPRLGFPGDALKKKEMTIERGRLKRHRKTSHSSHAVRQDSGEIVQ